MRKSSHAVVFTLVFLSITVIFVQQLYESSSPEISVPAQLNRSTSTKTYIESSPDEKYMSFFPHGGFATQHEAVRNAFRIALETNRTLILPQIRLGTKHVHWEPFPRLRSYYESQDKELLRQSCSQNLKIWQTELHSCQDLDNWIEVPWSFIFDIATLQKEFNIRIIERTDGHGWGINEPLLSHLDLKESDVTILDPNSFPSNDSRWTTTKDVDQQSLLSFFSRKKETEFEESLKLKSPLNNVVTANHLHSIQTKYLQFGTLVYGYRFKTTRSQEQIDMAKALKSTMLLVPDQIGRLNDIAQEIVQNLGGVGTFNMMHMDIQTLAQNQIKLNKEAAEIEGKTFVEKDFDQLDNQSQSDLMATLARELHSDMPINQAISAALPFEDSILGKFIQTKLIKDRKALLDACVDYKKNFDSQYPIYYFHNDVYSNITAYPELFRPLIDTFPCTFTISDMYSWGVVEENWDKDILEVIEEGVDYKLMFSQILEILIARKAYSFFEVPTTKLTRFLSWH